MNHPDTPNVQHDSADEAFLALHHGLPRQGPGSDASTRYLLQLAGPLPERPRVLDAGCGPGRSALLLAECTGGHVTGVDLHQPFLDELSATAANRGLGEQIAVLNGSMDRLPLDNHSFDVIWAEGSVYTVGFDTALRAWLRLLASDGVVVVTEIEWTTPSPCPQARSFWEGVYQLRTAEDNITTAEAADYQVIHHWPLPESDWWTEYYTPLTERIATVDPDLPGTAEAVAATREEITLRREHGHDYRYAGYILRPNVARSRAAG